MQREDFMPLGYQEKIWRMAFWGASQGYLELTTSTQGAGDSCDQHGICPVASNGLVVPFPRLGSPLDGQSCPSHLTGIIVLCCTLGCPGKFLGSYSWSRMHYRERERDLVNSAYLHKLNTIFLSFDIQKRSRTLWCRRWIAFFPVICKLYYRPLESMLHPCLHMFWDSNRWLPAELPFYKRCCYMLVLWHELLWDKYRDCLLCSLL